MQKCRLIFFLTKRMVLVFLFNLLCFLISKSVLNDHYCDEFVFQLYSMQYKLVFFMQSFTNQCCTRNTSWKVIVHCTFLVFKRNADECKISVLNYVDLCAWYWSVTLLMFRLRGLFFFSWNPRKTVLYILSCS